MNCELCKGKGIVIVEQRFSDGDIVRETRTCHKCMGSGLKHDEQEGDDFDIGGSSYTEEDDRM